MNTLTEHDWSIFQNAKTNIKTLNDVTYQQARTMLTIIDNLTATLTNIIVQTVKTQYEVTLGEFRLYDTPEELFHAEKENLSIYAQETNGAELGSETNVFKVGDKWIYAVEWHDVEWDA